MADVATGADAIRWRLTGAAAADLAQTGHALSLGGYRSSTRVHAITFRRYNAMSAVTVDYVSPNNGPGLGVLNAADTGKLTYTPPGGTEGASVTIANGETKQIPGNDTDKFLIVTRVSANDLGGSETVQIFDETANVIGGSDFSSAEAVAGAEKYRGLIAHNDSTSQVTDLKVWIDDDYDTNVRIAAETVSSDAIQTIADEDTAPTGRSWSTPVSEGTALNLGTVNTDNSVGLWIERSVDPGASADAQVKSVLLYSFTLDGSSYSGALRGVSRIANAASVGYLFFAGDGADPDPLNDTPDESFSSLPHTTTWTAAADKTYHLFTAARNQYGLISPFDRRRMVTMVIDDSYDETGDAPNAPASVELIAQADGDFLLQSAYHPAMEGQTESAISAARATEWAIWYTGDGTTPDETGDPDITVSMGASNMTQWLYRALDLGYLEGQTVKVLVRTRRNDAVVTEEDPTPDPIYVYSTNTTLVTATAEWFGPARPTGQVTMGHALGIRQRVTPPTETTEYIDEANNIRWVYGPGYTQLWADTVLVWNLKYASNAAYTWSGLFTPFKVKRGASFGAGASDAVEVAEWGAQKTLYVTVNGTRHMKIDVTAQTIEVGKVTNVDAVSTTRSDSPIWRKYADTCLQVWDTHTEDWATPVSLSSAGTLAMDVRIVGRVQAECM